MGEALDTLRYAVVFLYFYNRITTNSFHIIVPFLLRSTTYIDIIM